MTYEVDVTAWKDWDGNDHYEKPWESDLPDVMGIFVHYWDPVTGDDQYTWLYIDPPDEGEEWSWDDWYQLTIGILTDHGFDM
jgi:hypothetical protein